MVEASMPGKSKLTADAGERAALRDLSKSEQRGEVDRARAILLTLEGRRAGEIAAVLGVHVSTVHNWRGYFAHGGAAAAPKAGTAIRGRRHAGAIAAAILTEDTRHNGGWTLGRLCAEIARRGGPAISPRWLSQQLRQRGLPGGGRATLSKGVRTQRRSRRAVGCATTILVTGRRRLGRTVSALGPGLVEADAAVGPEGIAHVFVGHLAVEPLGVEMAAGPVFGVAVLGVVGIGDDVQCTDSFRRYRQSAELGEDGNGWLGPDEGF
jgi:transposase